MKSNIHAYTRQPPGENGMSHLFHFSNGVTTIHTETK